MAIQIRCAALESDREELIELFRRYLTPQSDAHRFQWLYRSSPYGPAWVWVACEGMKGAIVGAAAAFPRKMYFDGKEKMSWVLGDFCLEKKYRSLGPALQLQRACLQVANMPPFEFCYDFPSESMMAVYKRLGVQRIGTLVRWAKLLRAERKLEPLVKSKSLARGIGAGVNGILARRGWRGQDESCELAVHHGPCGEEFSALDQAMRMRPGIFSVRTAEYLNWRYLAHPGTKHEILAAQRSGELIGYAVFNQRGEDGNIVDICSMEEPGVIARLIAGVTDVLTPRGVATISMNAGDAHPWGSVFERAGFRRREAAPVVVFPTPASSRFANSWQSWFLMQGERDS